MQWSHFYTFQHFPKYFTRNDRSQNFITYLWELPNWLKFFWKQSFIWYLCRWTGNDRIKKNMYLEIIQTFFFQLLTNWLDNYIVIDLFKTCLAGIKTWYICCKTSQVLRKLLRLLDCVPNRIVRLQRTKNSISIFVTIVFYIYYLEQDVIIN